MLEQLKRIEQVRAMTNKSPGEDRYMPPGTKVRRDFYLNDDVELTSEYGIVVCCWQDTEIGMHDCYIAFFGHSMPTGKPDEKPYLLRYASISLTEC